MTEAEWLACKDPWRMLTFLHQQRRQSGSWKTPSLKWRGAKSVTVDDRKFQMLLLAYYRRHARLFDNRRDQTAFEVAESYVRGRASVQEVREARQACITANSDGVRRPSAGYWIAHTCLWPQNYVEQDASNAYWALLSIRSASFAVTHPHGGADSPSEQRIVESSRYYTDESVIIAWLMHDTNGNPFRPVTLDPSWLTPTVRARAAGIYADRAFDRMPILADALQDTGCENEEVLNHCRQPAEHVRGCWVVDLFTGRS